MGLRPHDVVVIANAKDKLLICNDSHKLMQEYSNYLRSWHTVITARNASLVLVDDPPTLPDKGYRCVLQDEPCRIGKELASKGVEPLRTVARNMLKFTDTYLFSYFDLFCNDTSCNAKVPGTDTMGMADDNHLTLAGSLYLWPYVCSFLSSRRLL